MGFFLESPVSIFQTHTYLQTSNESCSKPEIQIFFLSSVKICGPGIYCLLNFFLLFFNKDTRAVWRKWFKNVHNLLFCKCMENDGKEPSDPHVLPINRDQRPRSCTLDTNASLNSLQTLSVYSTRLKTLEQNQETASLSKSTPPNDDPPLQINGDASNVEP